MMRQYSHANEVRVRGQISKFAVGCGRGGTDRQFFFVNGRPCSPTKVPVIASSHAPPLTRMFRVAGAEGVQ